MTSAQPRFVAEAERFAERHGDALAFRLLKAFLRCSDEELAQTVKHLYCASIPENTYAAREGPLKTYLGIALLPLSWLARKKVSWRTESATEYNLETIDPPYFEQWFSSIYGALPQTKRVTPRIACVISGAATTDPVSSAVAADDLVALLLAAPLLIASLALLRLRSGIDLFQAVRQALSIYAVHRAYFRRYPCRHFITFDDESNHPARHLAFARCCRGELIVIQNGERIAHPRYAYGRVDRYFVYSKAYERMLLGLGVTARRFEPVGSLVLNARFKGLQSEPGPRPKPIYDILFIDQGTFPLASFDRRLGKALDKLLGNLASLMKQRPELRVAYQLRCYGDDAEQRAAVSKKLAAVVPSGITVLANDGRGESYRNALRSRLVLTFESTFGFEAMMLGAKALFVNYSGDPSETLCDDERFQLVDDKADFETFAAKVSGLLELELDAVPAVALERHAFMDGRVAERIAAALPGADPMPASRKEAS